MTVAAGSDNNRASLRRGPFIPDPTSRIAAVLDPSDAFRTQLQTVAVLNSNEFVRRAAIQALATGWPDHPDTDQH